MTLKKGAALLSSFTMSRKYLTTVNRLPKHIIVGFDLSNGFSLPSFPGSHCSPLASMWYDNQLAETGKPARPIPSRGTWQSASFYSN